MSASRPKESEKQERRGPVLDVLRDLLRDGRNDDALAVVSKLVSRNHELELLLAKLKDAKNRGERIPIEQLDLFLSKLRDASEGDLAKANADLEEAAKSGGGRTEPTKPPKQPPVRRPPPPDARRIDNPIPVPAAERPCPKCGGERKCIFHEKTEVIDLIPAEVIVRVDSREVLVCESCESEIVIAPLGDKVTEGGAYGSCLVATLVVQKYWDGLPLNRQGQMLERLGLSMPSSSMGDQIQWATELCAPIWRFLTAKAITSTILHIDGTSLPVKDRDSPNGLIIGTLWGYVGDDGPDDRCAVFLYTRTGKRNGQVEGEIGPADLLGRRVGPVCADAAGLFDSSFNRPELIEIGCNMHARRYFVKALEAGDARAAVPIAAYRALYDAEASVTASLGGASPQTVLEARQQRSKPVYEELKRWCETYMPLEPPGSRLYAAMRYLTNHYVALTRFLDDGRFPIDNGIVERNHRRPAVGRRNYLFAGSHAGAERAAIAYSICATCSLLGINPVDYLADVLPKLARGDISIARDIPALAPAAWKAARLRTPCRADVASPTCLDVPSSCPSDQPASSAPEPLVAER